MDSSRLALPPCFGNAHTPAASKPTSPWPQHPPPAPPAPAAARSMTCASDGSADSTHSMSTVCFGHAPELPLCSANDTALADAAQQHSARAAAAAATASTSGLRPPLVSMAAVPPRPSPDRTTESCMFSLVRQSRLCVGLQPQQDGTPSSVADALRGVVATTAAAVAVPAAFEHALHAARVTPDAATTASAAAAAAALPPLLAAALPSIPPSFTVIPGGATPALRRPRGRPSKAEVALRSRWRGEVYAAVPATLAPVPPAPSLPLTGTTSHNASAPKPAPSAHKPPAKPTRALHDNLLQSWQHGQGTVRSRRGSRALAAQNNADALQQARLLRAEAAADDTMCDSSSIIPNRRSKRTRFECDTNHAAGVVVVCAARPAEVAHAAATWAAEKAAAAAAAAAVANTSDALACSAVTTRTTYRGALAPPIEEDIVTSWQSAARNDGWGVPALDIFVWHRDTLLTTSMAAARALAAAAPHSQAPA